MELAYLRCRISAELPAPPAHPLSLSNAPHTLPRPPTFPEPGTSLTTNAEISQRKWSRNLIFREIEDRDLIAKARRGHVDAYNVLVSRWEKRVFNYLLRLVGNREDALDLSQDVFLKAYQNLKKLEDEGRFAAWLYRIAHNEAYSLLRKNRPEGEMTVEPTTLDLTGRMYPVELSLAVERALAGLNVDQREAVQLKVYQGFKFDEMAEILGCPVSTVKSRLYTALDLLKESLAPIEARPGTDAAAKPNTRSV